MSIRNLVNNNKKILGVGEIMMRLSPRENELLKTSTSLAETYGGGEGNVICSLASFGHTTKFFTKLPDSDLGRKAIRTFKERDVDTSNIVFGEGRLGIYFLEEGHGVRNSKVIYDRAYSAFSMMNEDEFDFDRILDDVKLLHISGITPALSKELRVTTINLLKEAKKRDIVISYDSNFRAKLWTAKECGEFLAEVLNYVDIALLGHLDITRLLNFEYEFMGNHKEDLKNLYIALNEKYPNIKYMASTKRGIESARRNSLVAYIFENGQIEESKKYTFDILDRVGGGDAFTAGILHGLNLGMTNKETIEFACGASVLKHSYKGDINHCDADEVNSFISQGIGAIAR